jgi:uncharacterized membrane protein
MCAPSSHYRRVPSGAQIAPVCHFDYSDRQPITGAGNKAKLILEMNKPAPGTWNSLLIARCSLLVARYSVLGTILDGGAMNPRLFMVIMYVGVGLLLALLSIPLMLRRIPPNHFYGFRLPKTINNPDIWYEINAYSGQRLFASGVITAVAAMWLYALAPGLSLDIYSSIMVGVALVTLGIGLGQSFYKLSKM